MDSAKVLKLADQCRPWAPVEAALRAYALVLSAVEAAPETPERVARTLLLRVRRSIDLDEPQTAAEVNAIAAAITRERELAAARSLASEAVLREALTEVLASAVPHPREHPTMTKAWAKARAALSAPSGAASGPVQEVDSDRCERCGTTAGPLLEPMLCVSCLAAPAASPAPNVAPLDWGGLCKKCGRNTEPVPEEIRNETRLAGHKWWCPACGYPVGCYYYDNPASPAPSAEALQDLLLWVQGCVVRAAHGLVLAVKERGIDGASLNETAVGVASGLMEVDAAITARAALQPKATPQATAAQTETEKP